MLLPARPTVGLRLRARERGARRRAVVDRSSAAALRYGQDLHVLGFDRVGDVLAQPRAPLALRFGPELGRRLDQATGQLAEPIEPIRPETLIEVRRAFAEPIGAAQTVARYIGELAIQLCDALEERGLGARRLDLICQRADSRAQAVRVGTSLPMRDVKRMTRLLCDKIETIDPGFGIEVMTLAATVTEPLLPKQASSSLIDQPEPDVSGLIALSPTELARRASIARLRWQATCRNARCADSRACA